MRNQRGITLIALVITIIVLLILAGVSISAITGENGIVDKAKDAAEKTKEAEQEENDMLSGYEQYIDSETSEGGSSVPSVLKRYILGEDGKGVDVFTIFNLSNNTFINNDIISDASTSLTFLNMGATDNSAYFVFMYDNDIYISNVNPETSLTNSLEKVEAIYDEELVLEYADIYYLGTSEKFLEDISITKKYRSFYDNK